MAKYDQTTVNLPVETKKRVRLIAAEKGVSMGKMALFLVEMGLKEYQREYAQRSAGDLPYAIPGNGPVMEKMA